MHTINLNDALTTCAAKFSAYQTLLNGLANGTVRHMLVRGPAGVGKSIEAEQCLREAETERTLRVHRAAGHTTPLALYNQLYSVRRPGDVLILDDCDAAFKNEQSLNILKAATDTRAPRFISWNSTSSRVSAQSFNYCGNLIIITNEPMRNSRYAALLDRITVFNLDLSPEERVARIITVLKGVKQYELNYDEVVAWVLTHYLRLGEHLTIRTAIKAMELAATAHDQWKELAELTLMEGT